MSNEEKADPAKSEDIPSTDVGPEQKLTESLGAGPEDADPHVVILPDNPVAVVAIESYNHTPPSPLAASSSIAR